MRADMHSHPGSLEFILNKTDRLDKPHEKIVDWFVRRFIKLAPGTPYQAIFRLQNDPRKALEQGKTDFIVWSDHHEIEPALIYIRENPDLANRIIVGEEIISHVKDRNFGVHINIYNLNRDQRVEIHKQMHDLYGGMLHCLKDLGLEYALMHPFFIPHIKDGRKVTYEDMKKLRDHFQIVEKLNGLSPEAENRRAQEFFAGNIGIAGSDSHCGSIGRCYTETTVPARNKQEFLKAVREGNVTFHGNSLDFKEAQKEIRTKPQTHTGEVYFWTPDFDEAYKTGKLSESGWKDPKKQKSFIKHNQRLELIDNKPVIVVPYKGTLSGELGYLATRAIIAARYRFFAKKLMDFKYERMAACIENF